MNGIKDNFHQLYGDELACPFLCPQEVDKQEQILTCKSLITHFSASSQQAIHDVTYSHLFGTVPQLNMTNIFLALQGIKKRLLQIDHEPACEGNSTFSLLGSTAATTVQQYFLQVQAWVPAMTFCSQAQ